MQSIAQLEVNSIKYPNSIESNQALAEEYAKQGRWEEATEAYQIVVALYPAIAALNVNRIRLGAIALGISSSLFLISEIVRPSMIMVEELIGVAQYMISPALAISNILFLPILILLSYAVISIYKLLSTSNDNQLAFWAMISVILGAGLFLPIFAIQAVVMPAAAQLYITGNTSALNIYDAVLLQPLASLFTLGGYLLLMGLTIFNIAIWGCGYLPKWAITLLWLGWFLFIVMADLPFNFINEILWIYIEPTMFALLVAVGGIGLAIGLWQQAPRQLLPKAAPAQEAH
jgi:hypothetical protein